MNEFYAICNWATMVPDFTEGGGGGGGQRGKIRILGHYDPIFKYPDIIYQKNNY